MLYKVSAIILLFLSAISFGQKSVTEDSLFIKSYTLREQGELDKSLDLLLNLQDKYPHSCILYNEIGVVYSNLYNNDSIAIIYYEKALPLCTLSDFHFNLGNSYKNLANYKKAKFHYEKSIELDSISHEGYYGIGLVQKYGYGNTDSAMYYYQKSYELLKDNYNENNPNHKSDLDRVLYALGNTAYDLGNYKKSIEYISKKEKANPNDVVAINVMANSYLRLKNYDLAIINYTKAISLNENYIYSINGLGNAYHIIGNDEKACHYWTEAQSKGYTYNQKWKKQYDIDDPQILIKKFCD